MAPCAHDRSAELLAGLHALEWRHDGPIPAVLLARLDVTGEDLARREAAADAALLDRLARDAVRAMAAARRGGHGAAGELASCRAGALARRTGRG